MTSWQRFSLVGDNIFKGLNKKNKHWILMKCSLCNLKLIEDGEKNSLKPSITKKNWIKQKTFTSSFKWKSALESYRYINKKA